MYALIRDGTDGKGYLFGGIFSTIHAAEMHRTQLIQQHKIPTGEDGWSLIPVVLDEGVSIDSKTQLIWPSETSGEPEPEVDVPGLFPPVELDLENACTRAEAIQRVLQYIEENPLRDLLEDALLCNQSIQDPFFAQKKKAIWRRASVGFANHRPILQQFGVLDLIKASFGAAGISLELSPTHDSSFQTNQDWSGMFL
jgi:hypothetical protein